MSILSFSTIEEGFELLREDYLINSEVCEGEYIDSLEVAREGVVYGNDETVIDPSVPVQVYMGAIQMFRQWDYSGWNGEEQELFGGIEVVTDENTCSHYRYFDTAVSVPANTRIGIRTPSGRLYPDDGIECLNEKAYYSSPLFDKEVTA